MATIANVTINASEFGAKVCLDLGDDMAVVEYANGRFVIADICDLAEFDEIMPISAPVKFASDDRAENIAAMVAKYHA